MGESFLIEIKAVLETIDDINWKELTHAYGSAEDVPGQIKALLSQHVKTRENAYWQLYGNIFHQGTRYEATPYAIPFLLELLQSEKTPQRELIIILLMNLALGYEEEYLLAGFDVEKFRREMTEAEEKMTAEERMESEKYGYSPQALLDIYENVQKGIPIFTKLLSHKDKEIRRAAIYALAWFPEKAKSSIDLILKQLDSFTEEKDISNALLSIGHLIRSKNEKLYVPEVSSYLTSDSALIRVSAAICLSCDTADDAVFDVLIDGLITGKELESVEGVHFNEGRISGYISLILSSFDDSKKSKIVSALCEALESVNSYQALDITEALLIIINRDRKVLIKDTPVENLGDLEFIVLHGLLNHGGWEIGGGGFVNFSELLRAGGIPDSQEKLAKYLNSDDHESQFHESEEAIETATVWKNLKDMIQQLFRFK